MLTRGASVLALASLLLTGAASAAATQHAAAATQAAGANVDWPIFGGSTDHTSYSSLSQINTSNVNQLGLAWTASEGPNLSFFETVPTVINGVMYYTTDTDQVRAVDATNGHLIWQYTPQVDFLNSTQGGGGGAPLNRGVTVVNGRVYLGTFDSHLIALQAATGEVLWNTEMNLPSAHYALSSPPTYYNGLLFVGSEAGDSGLRGYVAAYDANTGKQVWRYYTIPAPGQGWVPAAGGHGGGDVWMPMTIDTTTGMLYFGTGNPSPDYVNSDRPGCDPWVNAIVALDALTGKFAWAHSELCNDTWDLDSENTPLLFNLTLPNGQVERVVGHSNKDGIFYVYDAKTGKIISQTQHLEPFSIPHLAPSPTGSKVCGGLAIEYGPESYSPVTGAVYIDLIHGSCAIYYSDTLSDINRHYVGSSDTGGYSVPLPGQKPGPAGGIAAIDPHTGKVIWKDDLAGTATGGNLSTAGGLVFTGADDGHLYGIDAATGKILWKPFLGLGMGAPPVAYEVNGTEYIAVAAGGNFISAGIPLGGTLAVFKLGGAPIHKLPSVANGVIAPVAAPSLAGYVHPNPFMWYRPDLHRVVIQVIAGLNATNSGFNFDGYAKGQATFTVPAAWNVIFEFRNNAALPHSMAVTSGNVAPAKTPAFGFFPVTSANPIVGSRYSTSWEIDGFAATNVGHFYISCLVPGHLESGMWDNFVISTTQGLPSLTTS
jgi:outer membrane protein assembly factor BamB